MYDRRLQSIQVGDLKLISSSDGRHELYDHRLDPAEQNDLASEREQDLRRLQTLARSRLLHEPEELPSAAPGDAPELSQELKERLRRMGYAR